MEITVIGAGYVGLVTAACLADVGNHVHCVDLDEPRIRMLQRGEPPIHEPGLRELLVKNISAGRLDFSTSMDAGVSHGCVIFLAVGTPCAPDGSADLSQLTSAAREIGRRMTDYKVVVNKSTVPVGTAEIVERLIQAEASSRRVQIPFAVVSNPEFLKEGAAIHDFTRPDRVVIGSTDERAVLLMRSLYAPYVRNHDRIIVMDPKSAELTKYAANGMLATRISFMNELANLADAVGADIESVRKGVGSDSRIGYSFLYAGTGYGGSCFPKDLKALMSTAAQHGRLLHVLEAVERVNEAQKHVLVDKIKSRFGDDLNGFTFAVWGLAFKPETDDVREAPSLVVIRELVKAGAAVQAHDPVAIQQASRAMGRVPRVTFANSPMQACEGASALVIVTEWREFRSPDFARMKSLLKKPVIFDGRNLFEPAALADQGFEYHTVGRNQARPSQQQKGGAQSC